jgi:hypothetical protein
MRKQAHLIFLEKEMTHVKQSTSHVNTKKGPL